MNSIKSIIDEIICVLNECDRQNEFDFLPEYIISSKPSPLVKPTAVFGVKEIVFGQSGFGEYLGTDSSGNTLSGRRCTAKISMQIFIPRSKEGYCTGEFFETVASYLSGCSISKNILSISIGPTSSQKVTDSFYASGELSVNAFFHTVSSPDRFASSFTVSESI